MELRLQNEAVWSLWWVVTVVCWPEVKGEKLGRRVLGSNSFRIYSMCRASWRRV